MADGERLPCGARHLNIYLLAVGKATKIPERELCARYIERTERIGRQLGITAVDVREVPDMTGPAKAVQEGERLLALRKPGPMVVLDERGTAMTSGCFADRLQGWLDSGTPQVNFAIGGADGHHEMVRDAADLMLSLGPMTLPHLMVRVVLLEQLYRAVTIRLNHPYHRA